ncbi:MAG: helix-hairpin-helix domain-containing protein [Ruminococcus sp.]|nr:helix-hairpin-helix domain-containing protein [Ruminococcus sp.]
MNKNKLTISIICFILIGFVAASSINQRKKKSTIQTITIIQSADSPTAPSDIITAATTVKKQKPKTTTATKTESAPVTEATTVEAEQLYININTAGQEELVKLPYIGDILADEIVSYRENNGDFRNIEEIMLVSGISDGIFSHICDSIYVENPIYDEEISEEPEDITEGPYEPEEITDIPVEEITESAELTLEDVVPIDLNSADIETLMLLPYVSEEVAVKIIELRENIGKFSHPYEIYYAEVMELYQIEEISEYLIIISDDSDGNN